MVILAKGIPQTLSLFGYQRFLNEFGCKGLAYVHRVGRGVSIGCTCVLSVFQAITISPGTPKWAELKVRAPLFIGVSIFLCWILSMQLHIITILFVTIEWRNDSIAEWKEYGFCYMVCPDRTAASFYAALLTFPDAVCLVLMLWTSGSMVLLLYRHKQRMRHISRNSTSPRSSAETKATQTIITLVSTFVSFYTLSVILNVHA
ncbi:vomeronasal type-1 receptor 4-like [Rhynchocyon petersi]